MHATIELDRNHQAISTEQRIRLTIRLHHRLLYLIDIFQGFTYKVREI